MKPQEPTAAALEAQRRGKERLGEGLLLLPSTDFHNSPAAKSRPIVVRTEGTLRVSSRDLREFVEDAIDARL